MPPLTEIQEVRLLIGDKDAPPDQHLTDNEIQHFLDENGDSPRRAAVAAARSLQRYFAIKAVDFTVGRMAVTYNHRATIYMQIVKDLEATLGAGDAAPFVGGISIAANNVAKTDSDAVDAAFTNGLHESQGGSDGWPG